MAHNPRLLGGLAVLASSALVAVATVAYVNAGDESPSKAVDVPVAPGVVPTPTPVATFSPSETPSASASATATAAPTASPSATASASASASPSKTASSGTYAYPKPTRTYDGLRLSATMNPGDGYTTTRFSMSVTASDGDGTVYLQSIDWGDGTKTSEANPQACKSYPPLTSPPGAYQPQADSYKRSFPHTYRNAGNYTVTVTVASVNKDCRPNGPAREDRVARFDGANAVTVTPPPPSTPTASPTPSPTAAP